MLLYGLQIFFYEGEREIKNSPPLPPVNNILKIADPRSVRNLQMYYKAIVTVNRAVTSFPWALWNI